MATISKEELEEQRETAKNVLIASYDMYERSITDMLERRKNAKDKNGNPIYSDKDTEKNLRLMKTMQQDVVERFTALGYSEDELKASVGTKKGKKKGVDRKALEEIMKKESARESMNEYIEKMRGSAIDSTGNNDEFDSRKGNSSSIDEYIQNGPAKEEEINVVYHVDVMEKQQPEKKVEIQDTVRDVLDEKDTYKETSFGDMSHDGSKKQMFGFVKLPSKGECYKDKTDKLRVAYLTAYDENMILSPNLYKDGEFLDYIAKSKILDKFDTNNLLQGDIEAVIIWLRATGYGSDYPIVVTDPETGTEFETSVDLSTLKYKEFNIRGDENGYFEFVAPTTGDKIKFKFLTYGDTKFLTKLKAKESNKVRVMMLRKYSDEIIDMIEDNEFVDDAMRTKIKRQLEELHREIIEKYEDFNDLTFTHELTDRLLLQTISVNGIEDRKYINDYIINMNVKDAAEYRKYVIDNTPGIDYNIEIQRPASLGGGSFTTFLRLDQFIFVNF